MRSRGYRGPCAIAPNRLAVGRGGVRIDGHRA